MRDEERLHRVYLSLGANLGDREQSIREAIRLIGERVGTVASQSSLIETEPWGFQSQNTFLNGAILCETTLTPHELLAATQQIERELGKRKEHATQRKPQTSKFKSQSSNLKVQSSKFVDRPIDIDILLYDDLRVNEPDLQIPHPLMYERNFVMVPLREILKAP